MVDVNVVFIKVATHAGDIQCFNVKLQFQHSVNFSWYIKLLAAGRKRIICSRDCDVIIGGITHKSLYLCSKNVPEFFFLKKKEKKTNAYIKKQK